MAARTILTTIRQLPELFRLPGLVGFPLLALFFILIVTAVSLTVILWAGTFFFQGYIYTEPSPGIVWQAPAAAALLTLGYTVWCLCIALNPNASPRNLPIDTILNFNPEVEMSDLKGKPAENVWAILEPIAREITGRRTAGVK